MKADAGKNTVWMKVVCSYLPDFDSDDYDRFMTNLRLSMWDNKQKILGSFMKSEEYDYYNLQSVFYQVFSDLKTEYSCEICPSDIKLNLYERFSKEYNVKLDVTVSKNGQHIAECLNPSVVNYYNNILTSIDRGVIDKQICNHIDKDGNVLVSGQSLEFVGSDCTDCFSDLKNVIKAKIPSVVSDSRVIDNPVFEPVKKERVADFSL